MIAWIPGANVVYSIGVGGLLLAHAVRSEAGLPTIARMIAYLAADSASSGVPVLGWAVDTLFPGHLLAARALQKDIEARHGKPVDTKPDSRRWSRRRARTAQ